MSNLRTAILSFIAVLAAGCGTAGTLTGNQCSSNYGDTAPAKKLNAFVEASNEFIRQADALDAELLATCNTMANDLAIPTSELAPTAGKTATEAACTRVSTEIRDIKKDLNAAASASVVIEYQPPVCNVQVQAYADCAARCDATYTPGTAQLTCEGGELRGTCSATCMGQCAVQASGSCTGSCEGECTASCTGTCSGQCEGTCSARDAQGNCNGTCMGTCRGKCNTGCTGSCNGQCVAQASAMCSGECRGMCTVAFQEPRCTGMVRPPMVDAQCKASCDASVNAKAQCTDAKVAVRYSSSLTGDLAMRASRLKTALQNNYGKIIVAAEKIKRIKDSGTALVDASATLPSAVGALGIQAGACVSSYASSLPAASAKVSVSVSVTASVSGSVSGSGG